MLLNEYAIDPEVLSDYEKVRYYFDNTGIAQGRLISRFPRNWQRMVYENCKLNCKPVEIKRVEERLARCIKKLVDLDRHYKHDKKWIENALHEHRNNEKFHAIISAKEIVDDCVLCDDDVDEENELWRSNRELAVGRVAEEMILPAFLLLRCATEVLFVDPHFTFVNRYKRPLTEFLKIAIMDTKLKRFEYHIGEQEQADKFKANMKRFSRTIKDLDLPAPLKFIRWRRLHSQEEDSFHARYILTERGGLRYDHGLDEGKPGETTDVSLLDEKLHQKRWDQFNGKGPRYKFIDALAIMQDGEVLVSRLRNSALNVGNLSSSMQLRPNLLFREFVDTFFQRLRKLYALQ